MRFILLFRCPIERAWSHWKMNQANGWDPLDFSTAIREGRTRVLDEAGPNGLSRRLSYVERGYYGRQIAELAKLFPQENCLYLRQEDLKATPQRIVDTVTQFLGLAPMVIAQHEVVNASRWHKPETLKDEDRQYLEALYAADLAQFKTLTGLTL